MKIAISSTGNTLDSKMDQRFGRCPYFLIVDSKTMSFKAKTNEATCMHACMTFRTHIVRVAADDADEIVSERLSTELNIPRFS